MLEVNGLRNPLKSQIAALRNAIFNSTSLKHHQTYVLHHIYKYPFLIFLFVSHSCLAVEEKLNKGQKQNRRVTSAREAQLSVHSSATLDPLLVSLWCYKTISGESTVKV